MIRIAYVIDTIDGPTAGTEQQLLMLLRHLDRTRFDPMLCVLRSSVWLEEEFDLCPVHEIGIRTFRDPRVLGTMSSFVRLLKTKRASVVHSFFRDGMRVGITAGRLAGVRLNVAGRRSQGYWMTPADHTVIRTLNRWVDLSIANSQHTKNWLVNTEGLPADRITVIYNGVELEQFRSVPADARATLRKELGIPPDSPVIGIVANLRPVKAHDVFLRAARSVAASRPDAHFILVGEGTDRTRLEATTSAFGIGAQTHFLGERQDIPSVLAAMDLGVLTSSSESFSSALVEYMATALPVVTTDVGGTREAVENGVNGFVVPTGDDAGVARAILHLLADAGRRKDMGEAGRRMAETRFGVSSMVRGHDNIYSSCEEIL